MHHAFAPVAPIHVCSPRQATTSFYVKQFLQRKKKKQVRAKLVAKAASIPVFPEQQAPPTVEDPFLNGKSDSITDPAYTTAQSFLGLSTNGRWHRDDESALSRSEPLPLPMTYPGSAPARAEVEKMKNCDPEIKDCRDVIYQWTGECSRCQGTGSVNDQKRKGRDVIMQCITCLGLGHVHKVTLRTDIAIVEEVGVA